MFSKMLSISMRRRYAAIGFLALSVIAVGCDETTEPDEEPEIATMRLIVGSQTINVNAETGVVTGGPIVIPVGATSISAQFLLANGQPEPLVTSTTFRLEAVPTNAAVVTFTRTGAFTGTLNGILRQTTTITFGPFHLEEQHTEFDYPVTVTVQ
jgi:hypothetical protein